MRIAAVLLPHFPCQAEVRREPRLEGLPLVIGDADRPRTVLDCSASAQAVGVEPGMPLRRTVALCPEATFLAPDPLYYRDAWEAILDALGQVSPEIEDSGLCQSYVNVSGLGRHYESDLDLGTAIAETVREACGLVPSVGIAEGLFPAFAAGVVSAPGETTVVPAGKEAPFLAPLDVGLLDVPAEVQRRLRLLALESIGEVAQLPLGALVSQFGREGKRLWELANGRDGQRLKPRQPVEVIEEGLVFEEPVAGIDVLIAAGRQLLSRLGYGLRERAAREMGLRAELASGRSWERRVVFREAVSERERLVFILRSVLANTPPPAPVQSLSLRLSGLVGETGKQLTFSGKGRLQRQLEEAVRQLKARYGFSPIYRCVDVEPWSVIPEERQILVESDG